jgi:hypothetical protein
MNALLQKVIGLQEDKADEGKIAPETVVYLTPEQIGTEEGAHCGACFFFRRPASECFLTSPPRCNAEKGVCDYYLHGNLWDGAGDDIKMKPQELIPKTNAGYIEEGPTHCATCEYFGNKGADSGPCEKVKGQVKAKGCCNAWEEC